jgi:hypothetical protein
MFYDRSIDSSRASSSESAIYKYCRPRTDDFGRNDHRAAQMKRTVIYESAHTSEYLNVATNKVAAFSISRATRLSLEDCLYT